MDAQPVQGIQPIHQPHRQLKQSLPRRRRRGPPKHSLQPPLTACPCRRRNLRHRLLRRHHHQLAQRHRPTRHLRALPRASNFQRHTVSRRARRQHLYQSRPQQSPHLLWLRRLQLYPRVGSSTASAHRVPPQRAVHQQQQRVDL